jgi:exonuclease V gamma subunit
MASGAGRLLDEAQLHADLPAALADTTITHAVLVDADQTTVLACPSNPELLLRDLLALYHDADRAVPPYVPRASYAYTAELFKTDPKERAHADVQQRALDKARSEWTSDDPSASGESEEPANQLLHQLSPVDEPAFGSTARAVYLPMLDAVVDP